VPEKKSGPFVIALTGSIAMGKTETAKMFARLGVPVYDADQAVHALYERDGAAVEPIQKLFPGAVKRGRVDRGELAKRIAGDPVALYRLESVVHPLVAKQRHAFLADAAAKGADVVVLDIPLLFETGGEKSVDAVVVVSAPRDVQLARVLARPGMTQEKFAALEARQMPDAEKRAKADYIIDTSKGLNDAFESVKRVIAAVRGRAIKKS
jgi:dephospho-CoA kinase